MSHESHNVTVNAVQGALTVSFNALTGLQEAIKDNLESSQRGGTDEEKAVARALWVAQGLVQDAADKLTAAKFKTG